MKQNILNLPHPNPINQDGPDIPYFIIGDIDKN